MPEEDRSKEMQMTEEQALNCLRNSALIPNAAPLVGYRLRFRLWHYPAFYAYQSWSVFELRRRKELASFIVRQVTWDRPYDCQRLRNPLQGLQKGFHTLPKIELQDRPLDRAELESRMDAGRRLSIPIIGQEIGLCVDGARYGYEEENTNLRIEWCCDGPAEWRELTKWAIETMKWLRDVCNV